VPSEALGLTQIQYDFYHSSAFFSEGYRFCVRYVSLRSEESSGDLSTEEATNILTSELALMPVQHVVSEGWLPTGSMGQEYGTNAAKSTR